MASSLPVSPKVRFAAFELDPEAGKLLKNGIPLKLQPQPFRLLMLLSGRPGQVVTREEIQRCLWGDSTFVDFERGINFSINQIRAALSDHAEKPRYIETLPRVGYRFIAALEPPEPPKPPDETPQGVRNPSFRLVANRRKLLAPPLAQPARWRRTLLYVLPITVASLVFGWLLTHHSSSSAEKTLAPIRSLAVLPLENLSGDASQDYFADGMTDELITNLGQIDSLRVISRTSVLQYRGVHKPLSQIARELNVDAVVEGTVLRSGGQVRITAQLIQGSADKHLWAQSYQRDLNDVLVVQDEIASAIAKQVRMTLRPHEQIRPGIDRPVNLEAYEAYLRGEYFLNRLNPDSTSKAAEYFQLAINKDPNYPAAYTKLGGCYQILANTGAIPKKEGYARAKLLLAKALELDPDFAAAHAVVGWRLLMYDLDFATAGAEFKRAVELNLNGVEGHQGLGDYYAAMGQLPEAVGEVQRARALDPLALIVNTDLCTTLFFARRYDEALAQCKANLDLDPNGPRPLWILGDVYAAKGMDSEAVTADLRALQLAGAPPAMVAAAKAGATESGLRGYWKALVPSIPKHVAKGELDPFDAALGSVYARNDDEALMWIEKAVEQRSYGIVYLGVDPVFDDLRSDPRFVSMLKRMGLPQDQKRLAQ